MRPLIPTLTIVILGLLFTVASLISYSQVSSLSSQLDKAKAENLHYVQTIADLNDMLDAELPLLAITRLDLMEDLLINYPHLSSQQKGIIVDTLFKEADAFDINPLIIYALIHAESSFRFWIEHPQVTINGQKMRAVGLGGVMWYWWGDLLSEASIVSNRSELFDPVTNIKSVFFIYNHLLNTAMHKDASNIHHSAMLRYFGGSYPHYVKSIEAKMMTIIKRKLYSEESQ